MPCMAPHQDGDSCDIRVQEAWMFPVSIEITRHERLPTPWECKYATGRFPA